MTPCPGDEELRKLLAGQLPAEDADPLTWHTDQCADCQRRLERLLDDPAAGRWRRLLGSAEGEPAPTKVAPGAAGADTARAAEGAPPAAATVREPADPQKRPDAALLRRLRVDPARRPPPAPPAPPGYEILGELGRGGMGVVYQARQTALHRLVALKVIGAGAWAGSGEVARFRAEAEAVARLQHPNIVQIYEVGDLDGRPFFSLEYVDGGSLADRLDGTPLPARAAAELIRTLALAIHAAHERGIVHRDLKPANILLQKSEVRSQKTEAQPPGRPASDFCLLTSDFFPKIADFGLAKRLGDDSGLTHTGTVLGTPSYMAPEQAEGQVHHIGPAADTYALGAILYELLTGRPPFLGASGLDTLQQVKSQTPVAPTRLRHQVPRDLETICLKCLEKEPHKRYPTARALAEDLQHFLAGEPILARPVTVWERTWKWTKRRPAVAALLVLLVVAPLALLAVGAWSYFRLKESNDFAESVVDDMYTKVAEEWLADEPQKDPLQKEFLEKALGFYQRQARKGGTSPEARRRAGLAYFRMGQLYRGLNRREEAADAYRQAIVLQEPLRQQYPGERDYRQDLANSYNWLGELLRDGGSLTEGEQNYRAALALQEGLHEEDAANPAYRRELARTYSNLGLVEMDDDRADQARQHFDGAVDLLEQLVNESPANEFRHELARTLTNRGVFRRTHTRPEDAEKDYRRAIQLLKGLRGTGRVRAVYDFNLAIAHLDLGNILFDREDYDQALAELDQADEILTRLVEDFPDRPRYKKKLARTYNSRGGALLESGEERPAEEDWQKARRLLEKLVEADPQEAEYLADLGKCVGNLGLLRFQQGDLFAAGTELTEAVRLLRAALKPNPKRPDYLEALRDHYQSLAEVLVRAGERGQAVEAAAALAQVFPERALGHYYAACFTARCVPLDEKAGDADGAAKHAAQAAAHLRQALDRGLTGAERLTKEDEPFAPLAPRPGWAELLAELETRKRPAPAQPAP
jgi:serine/threonine-protein kinase